MTTLEVTRPRLPRAALVGLVLTLAVAAALLWWAKWSPYAAKTSGLLASHTWPGSDVLATAGAAGQAPSWSRGVAFALAYGKSVWAALVAALVISAAVDALVPRTWLLRALERPGRLGSLRPALLALPTMMCTCCSAPVAATLRRAGASTRSVLAFWIASPVLNPAVLVFLLLVAPWQWAATRLVVGLLLVLAVTALVATLERRATAPDPAGLLPTPERRSLASRRLRARLLHARVLADTGPEDYQLGAVALAGAEREDFRLASAPARFARTLARLALVLVPEYILVVLAVGVFRGWLFPLAQTSQHSGSGALVALGVALVAGTLVVLPTGGEIPILQGLAHTGASSLVLGALLITLPAISLPSMVMLGRALSWRVVTVMAAGVAACGVAAALLLFLLA